MHTPTYDELKKELVRALDIHIDILKDTSLIDPEHLDGIMFMMRSFGFMLDRAPKVLLEENPEEMNFLMFQYYSLLSELKYNLRLNYPHAHLQQRSLEEIVQLFPTTYEKEMKVWWEQLTGLHVDDSKQTIEIEDLNN
ncbi:hypothetical protein IV487_06820 [Enterococcus saccharolyticus]|uniref:hypothetical protein n=1 Tax=Enterococcus TaxID=1350 RepID=UPI001E2A292E|nr:hypothetical protein [Enterococcus saccharolyticus]MCD5002192.1 hypothetical protein [Enterococcus saccharolyticus]